MKIIKAGLLDTVQDAGRYGYRYLGINPGGAMERFSASLANALLGKDLNAPLIEMHFPAAQILFQTSAVVCLTGADFTPTINNEELPLHKPVIIYENPVIEFKKWRTGARCYLSVLGNFKIEYWLNSYSTNLKAGAGGFKGRRLLKDDVLEWEGSVLLLANGRHFETLPWQYNPPVAHADEIHFIPGAEWDWLTTKAQTLFLNNTFAITAASDRMGYRLNGEALQQNKTESLVSSPVAFGTVQLLPDGQLIILMADAQTTGGYPRLANVISADLPKLAQMNAGATIRFTMTNSKEAEARLAAQQTYLSALQNTCGLKMQNRFNAH
ncbi:MAG TPA: biotin-dependent carboxyltransferase family protein [Flavisolibacter sp.]|nr:biotin-dependent carboxyltransferase family protein [Flavisolibacter sp.]